MPGRIRFHQDRPIDPLATARNLTVTHRSSVTEDQIDHLGHMNVRFYGVNAHAGTVAVMAALGIDPAGTEVGDAYTRHRREQLLGAQLEVRSGALSVAPAEIRLYHELANTETGDIAATFVHRIRSASGPTITLPDDVAVRADALTTTIPAHGVPRSIPIESDPIGSAPTLPDLHDRGLAMRKVRAVNEEECTADGAYVRTFAPMLVWGGEPVERDQPEMLHTTADGRAMGWASMETRLAIRRLPRIGDRIQSFSAVLAVADKISHRILWAYDVERGDLLVSFEIVNLAFDVAARSPMSIPANIRAAESATLHPDLAPQASSVA